MKEKSTSISNSRLRMLSYGVIVYMLMALAWWSVLLFIKNADAFHAKSDLMKLGMIAEGAIHSEAEFYSTDRYKQLFRQYQKQEHMILGEAVVFVISLVIGIWLINRGYHKEVMAARQRRNFLLSITHELKSPLASIRLVLETLIKRDLARDQLVILGQKGLKETDRLTGLVNDLLLSAKLETAYQPQWEELDLCVLFSELVQRMHENYPQVKFNFETTEPAFKVFADRLGITSVALNLLENAVKYAREEPQITVKLSKTDHETVQIEVADNGPGIEDKEKKRIFEKFYRVGNEDTRETKGTGLGLFIVDQIVKTHRGQIAVLDNTPHGALFRIQWPITPA